MMFQNQNIFGDLIKERKRKKTKDQLRNFDKADNIHIFANISKSSRK